MGARPAVSGLWAVLLAAGGSSRLGHPKQLVELDGTPLLVRAIDALRAVVGDRLRCVLGAGAADLAHLVPAGRVVVAADWSEGVAASLRAGIAALPAGASAALLATCDQYRLQAADYARLAAAWSEAPGRCAVARYAGIEGVPAIVPRRLFPALCELSGDAGARHMLRRQPDPVVVDLEAAAEDLDAPEDLRRLRRLESASKH